jgi:hypothetical protein
MKWNPGIFARSRLIEYRSRITLRFIQATVYLLLRRSRDQRNHNMSADTTALN